MARKVLTPSVMQTSLGRAWGEPGRGEELGLATEGEPSCGAAPPESGPRMKDGALNIILEHRRLLDLLAALEELAEDDAEGDWRSELARLVDELLDGLRAHFAAEVTTTSAESLPRSEGLARELRRLDAEHPVLLESFWGVRTLAMNEDVSRQEVRLALGIAAQKFRDHEAEENALFVELL